MALPLSPPPVPPELLKKRWNEGKRTLAELDPAFWQWHLRNQRYFKFQKAIILLGLTGIIFTILMIIFSK